MKTRFYDEMIPLVEERLKDVDDNYDELMVSFISFAASTMVEKTISQIDNGIIKPEQLEKFLSNQLNRTIDCLVDTTKLILNNNTEEIQEKVMENMTSISHPTLQ